MPSLLIIGGTGELGEQTVAAAKATDGTGWDGEVIATYRLSAPKQTKGVTWVRLNCDDHKALRSFIANQDSIGAVIYCAVPKHGGASGKGGETVRTGIIDDVVNCAEASVMVGARFVAVSTDLVFDGNLPEGQSYDESSPTCPPNPYGKYKQEMERQLLTLGGNVVIARTSLILTVGDEKLLHSHGKGIQFVVDCIKGKHGEIELFEDELRSMSFSDDLGKAFVELGKKECQHRGIIHLVSDEVTNRWELAKLLAKKLGMEEQLGKTAKSGLSKESGLNRPLNCGLNTKVKNSVLKTKIRGISERLG